MFPAILLYIAMLVFKHTQFHGVVFQFWLEFLLFFVFALKRYYCLPNNERCRIEYLRRQRNANIIGNNYKKRGVS
jgi:hypothetical protein